ncbi:MAG: DUF1800 family protein [Oceanospirillaceae bacterium]|nr:DUF1800 family protein [Oceanospirillaceae bacterium]
MKTTNSPKSPTLNYMMRVGLLPRPEHSIPGDPVNWAIANLYRDDPTLSPPSDRDTSTNLQPWPEELDPGIRARLVNLWRWDEARDSIREKMKNAPERERQDKLDEAQFKYDLRWHDAARMDARGAFGEDSVRQRFGHFWFNHFTVGNYDAFYTAGDMYEHRILAHMNGSFADLLYEATTHYSMLRYLDNVTNVSPRSEAGRIRKQKGKQVGFNDNLAREIMELHSCSPAQGYTEKDISEAARLLAGWGDWALNPRNEHEWYSAKEPFVRRQSEPGTKVILGKEYGSGHKALREFTRDLAALEQTRKYLCHKLALHFISDTPSSRVTDALESAWRQSDGNLGKVHEKLLELAWTDGDRKILWPSHWLYNTVRISGSNFFMGHKDIFNRKSGQRAMQPMRELGISFWEERQPNGYPLLSKEWISLEHLDRRIRFASTVFGTGSGRETPAQIMANLGVPKTMRAQMLSTGRAEEQFTALVVNQWAMEVQA